MGLSASKMRRATQRQDPQSYPSGHLLRPMSAQLPTQIFTLDRIPRNLAPLSSSSDGGLRRRVGYGFQSHRPSKLIEVERKLSQEIRQRDAMECRANGKWRLSLRGPGSTLVALSLAGCASASLDRAGSLSSYTALQRSDGLLTRSELFVNKDLVLAAKTVKIVPTLFAEVSATAVFGADQRALVSNAIDRELCLGLSGRFKIAKPGEPADLTVHAVVSSVAGTNAAAAGVSKVAGFLPSILLPGVPIPVPRIPIGLGSLSVEAEAIDEKGSQAAAMIWALGANSLTSGARGSSSGDAYELASSFAGDFSKLVTTGEDPFKAGPSLPDGRKLMVQAGLNSGDPGCAVYGKNPGVVGLIGGGIGAPPEWTDGGKAEAKPAE